MIFYCVYFMPNDLIQDFRKKMDSLEDNILSKEGRKVVAGDFNGGALEWGTHHTDSLGRRRPIL